MFGQVQQGAQDIGHSAIRLLLARPPSSPGQGVRPDQPETKWIACEALRDAATCLAPRGQRSGFTQIPKASKSTYLGLERGDFWQPKEVGGLRLKIER